MEFGPLASTSQDRISQLRQILSSGDFTVQDAPEQKSSLPRWDLQGRRDALPKYEAPKTTAELRDEIYAQKKATEDGRKSLEESKKSHFGGFGIQETPQVKTAATEWRKNMVEYEKRAQPQEQETQSQEIKNRLDRVTGEDNDPRNFQADIAPYMIGVRKQDVYSAKEALSRKLAEGAYYGKPIAEERTPEQKLKDNFLGIDREQALKNSRINKRKDNLIMQGIRNSSIVGSHLIDDKQIEAYTPLEKMTENFGSLVGMLTDLEAGGIALRGAGYTSKAAAASEKLVNKMGNLSKTRVGDAMKGLLTQISTLPIITGIEGQLENPDIRAEQYKTEGGRAKKLQDDALAGFWMATVSGGSKVLKDVNKLFKPSMTMGAGMYTVGKLQGMTDEQAGMMALNMVLLDKAGSLDAAKTSDPQTKKFIEKAQEVKRMVDNQDDMPILPELKRTPTGEKIHAIATNPRASESDKAWANQNISKAFDEYKAGNYKILPELSSRILARVDGVKQGEGAAPKIDSPLFKQPDVDGKPQIAVGRFGDVNRAFDGPKVATKPKNLRFTDANKTQTQREVPVPPVSSKIELGSRVRLDNGNIADINKILPGGRVRVTERVVSAKKEALWKSRTIDPERIQGLETQKIETPEDEGIDLGDFVTTKQKEAAEKPMTDTQLLKATKKETIDRSIKGMTASQKLLSIFTTKSGLRKQIKEKLEPIRTGLYKKSKVLERELKDHDFDVLERKRTALKEAESFIRITGEKDLKKIKKDLRGAETLSNEKFLKEENTYNEMLKTRQEGGRYVEAYKGMKEPNDVLKAALNNGDVKMAEQILKPLGIEVPRKLLDKSYEEMKSLGIPVNYQKNHFPRVVIDPKGLSKAYEKRIGKKAYQELKDFYQHHYNQKAEDADIASFIDEFLVDPHGLNGQKLDLGNLKSRVIKEITPDLLKYYAEPADALAHYINNTSEAIAMVKYLNKGNRVKTMEGSKKKTRDSIDSYVMRKLADGVIKPSDVKEIEALLRARFSQNKPGALMQNYLNISYATSIGNTVSAVSQLPDVIWGVFRNGVKNGVGAYGKNFINEVVLRPLSVTKIGEIGGKSLVDRGDFGMETLKMDLYKDIRTGRWLSKTLDAVGFSKMSKLGEQSFIDSTVMRVEDWVGGGRKATETQKEMEDLLGKTRTEQLKKDFRNGKVTADLRRYTYEKLADFYPVSKSELPAYYNTAKEGRAFYAMKVFMVRGMDTIRRQSFTKMDEGFKLIQEANLREKKSKGFFRTTASLMERKKTDLLKIEGAALVRKGMKDLMSIAMLWMMAQVPTNTIKDLMLGRNTSISDRAMDAILSLGFFVNKYSIYQFREKGVARGVLSMFGPPTHLVQTPIEDYIEYKKKRAREIDMYGSSDYSFFKDAWSVNMIPMIGKNLNWKYGRGSQIQEYKDKERAKSEKWFDRSMWETFSKLPFMNESRDGERINIAKVVGNVDGDTIEVEIDGKVERIRMLGIDTPETTHYSKAYQFMGKEASDFAKKKLKPGDTVRLRSDVTNDERDRTTSKRLLAYVETLPKDAQWLFKVPGLKKIVPAGDYNRELLKAGLAAFGRDFPSTREEDYTAQAAIASDLGIGIYDERAEAEYYDWLYSIGGVNPNSKIPEQEGSHLKSREEYKKLKQKVGGQDLNYGDLRTNAEIKRAKMLEKSRL